MSVLESLVAGFELPMMAPVRQIFDATELADVASSLCAGFAASGVAARIKPGARIAIAVGSRGLADLPLLVSTTVSLVRDAGGDPFIVPAMGSHGAATAQGQTELLAQLGVTEESAGCPVLSSMETVELGKLDNGLSVLMDKNAMGADGIALINRVKPHTGFTAPIESGLCKMLSIGLGKQKGAEECHARGMGAFKDIVVQMAAMKLERAPVLFGVATIENGYDRIRKVEVVPAEEIIAREPSMLELARANMPRVLFSPLDVLIVDQIGKEYSGAGMDPNITGRSPTPFLRPELQTTRLAVLDLSNKSRGNAAGLGMADITTRRVEGKIDRDATYANHITSTVLPGARLPIVAETDSQAIRIAAKTANVADPSALRVVRVPNTLHLGRIMISAALLEEARDHPQIEILGDLEPWPFDEQGSLFADRQVAAA